MLDVGDPAVDLADGLGSVQGGPDERVHLPGRVDVAHPVVAVGSDPQAGERVDERLRVMASVRGVAIAGLVGDVREGPSHLVVDRVRRQQRLGIHGVHVVDPVEQRRLDAVGAQGTRDDVEDHGPP